MRYAKVFSAQNEGLNAHIIEVEVDLSKGLHSFNIVGLGDKAVDEARDRVSAAIKNTGFKPPKQRNQKIVVSLAPADLRKSGPMFDLSVALGFLLAADEIKFDPTDRLFLGELSLNGFVRRVRGVLPLVREAKRLGFGEVFVPWENAEEAALIEGISIFPVRELREAIAHLNKKELEQEAVEKIPKISLSPQPKTKITYKTQEYFIDISDVAGQESAKRALEIAASGGHNIALYGPAGTGKTMLARSLSGILPPLHLEEILEVTGIHSTAGLLSGSLVTEPPFRAPHHTSSYIAVVGGGPVPRPGEITLAHRGVLFLDEFPEFDSRVIETLREPLESREVSISRAKGTSVFPANFILVVAMNPCPCGNAGVKGKECKCSVANLARYDRKLSGPIVDRIDLWAEVSKVEYDKLGAGVKNVGIDKAPEYRTRIIKAREIQRQRFIKTGGRIKLNAEMEAKDLHTFVPLDSETREVLIRAGKKYSLSARSFHRLIKIARSIADLASDEHINQEHILEAISYRPKQLEKY